MIIDLPQSFSYAENARNKAYVEDNKLIIVGHVNFEALMYQITYATKDASKCYYCGETLKDSPKTRSLDHMYPKKWGGISIPCNLVPACNVCNTKKDKLTETQYICWRDVRRRSKRRLLKLYTQKNKTNSYLGKIMPKEWMVEMPLKDISEGLCVCGNLGPGYSEVCAFFSKHHHYLRPVVMSSNGIILDGKDIARHAMAHNVDRIPAIIFENVIVRERNESEVETQ